MRFSTIPIDANGRPDPDLHLVLDRTSELRVVCIGDAMLDRFVYGDVTRVSPEAPVPILRGRLHQEMVGGVANVTRKLTALGAEAVLIAVVGDDEAGRRTAEFAAEDERVTDRLVVDPSRPTTTKTRFVASDHHLMRLDEETTAPISDAIAQRVLEILRAEIAAGADALIISDYAKGVLTDEVLRTSIETARDAGIPVIADPKRPDFSAYAGVDLLKPNVAELQQATHLRCESDPEVEAAAFEVLRKNDIKALLVTRSSRGMTLVRKVYEPLHLPARAVDVIDVSGAGDSVVATAAVALAAGAGLDTAAELANFAGALVVHKPGTATLTCDELRAAVLEMEVSSIDARILSPSEAASSVAGWRKRQLRVGFTNGCFDVLHPGHLALLGEARKACDRLIVAINSDASVKRLKGDARPIQPEATRAIVLASLALVDAVIVFDDDTPIPLLQRLRPDVLVKGGDYTLDEVVGADIVRGYGGEVRLAEHVAGHSSTAVIERMTGGAAPAGGRTAAQRS